MNTHADKTQENKSQSVANASYQNLSSAESKFQFIDNRPEVVVQQKFQEMANNSLKAKKVAQFQAMADKHSAKQQQSIQKKENNVGGANSSVIQRIVYPNMGAMWGAVHPGYALANIAQDSVLSSLYNDAAAQLPNVDFNLVGAQAPQITSTPMAVHPYRLDYDLNANLGLDNDYYAGAIIHELAHAASSQQYRRQGVNQNMMVFANLNLPVPVGVVNPVTGMTPNQLASYQGQMQTLDDNWQDLEAVAQQDHNNGALGLVDYNHIDHRIQYALATAFVHNETVLGDMMYYLKAKNLDGSKTYKFARRMLKEANDRRQNGFWSNADTEVRRVDSRAWWFQFWKW